MSAAVRTCSCSWRAFCFQSVPSWLVSLLERAEALLLAEARREMRAFRSTEDLRGGILQQQASGLSNAAKRSIACAHSWLVRTRL